MTSQNRVRRSLTAVLLGLAIAFASAPADAAENTFKQSAELGKSTAKTSSDIDKYVAQLDKTEKSLSSVSQAQRKNLKKQYESFSKEVKNLEKAQQRATSDINGMKAKGTQYFSLWDESITQISNPELKQASIERRTKVMDDHDEIASSLSAIGTQLEPFMSNLSDIKAFLGTDLSPANVSKGNDMIQKSQKDAQALKKQIAPIQTKLKALESEAPK